jgi:hypothetical protein
MKISFVDFWPKFDPNNNFFLHLLRDIKEDVQVVYPEDSEILFFGPFGNENSMYKNCKKVFYTGEDIKPNFKKCDYSLTFEFDNFDEKNIRLPLWYLYIDWFNVSTYSDPEWLIPVEYLDGNNEFTKKNKNKFCSIVFSNINKVYDLRMGSIEKLKKYKPVDCFGKIHSNSIPDGEKNKLDIISNYKFSICFENSTTPGYFTEKLLHAKIAGTIPIYYSNKSFSEDFNPNCCLNYIKFSSLDELYDKVIEIDQNEKLYKEIFDQPLFLTKPNLDTIKNNILKIL